MKKLLANFDWAMTLGLLVLLVLGLMILRSVAPTLFPQQLASVLIGLFLFFVLSQIDFQLYLRFRKSLYLVSIAGLILTFTFGAVRRGAARWFELAGFAFQPSELVKPFLILALAAFLQARPVRGIASFLANFWLMLIPVVLIFWQPDLGSALVVAFFWLMMVLANGIPWRLVATLLILILTFLPLSWFLLQSYQQSRIMTFLNPFSDPLGRGYNMIQAMIAVGSGQLLGRGLGRGTQSHLQFLPERHTDFIFASFCEELGFVGGLFLLSVFAFLLWRILKAAQLAESDFGCLVAVGVFSLVFFQVLVNTGMNLGLLPITGITLPLVSFGGSSLVSTMISLGIVNNIARQSRKQKKI